MGQSNAGQSSAGQRNASAAETKSAAWTDRSEVRSEFNLDLRRALPLERCSQSAGPSSEKILGVWEGKYLLWYCQFYFNIVKADSQTPSTYFGTANSTLILSRLTLRLPVLTLVLPILL